MLTDVLTRPRGPKSDRTDDFVTAPRHGMRVASHGVRDRCQRLLESEIAFIPNRSFLDADSDKSLGLDQPCSAETLRRAEMPRDLPGHLARLCESKLLTAAEEAHLFRRMNFLKFRANAIRSKLNPEQPDAEAVELAERYLAEAKAVRDRIVQANMRLVMSIVKKFVTPQHSFDDLLSDGIYALMQAAEKFDYSRGFRFSTYAYRAIARNAYRKIKDRQKESVRFASNSDEGVFNVLDQRNSSYLQDEAWDRLRNLLAQMMGGLDRRERFVIRSRYALGSHRKVRTFQYLADKLGVSKERARQLEQRAVAKLRSFAAQHQLDELVGPALA
jgi:RNA polymerase primary sigma factor